MRSINAALTDAQNDPTRAPYVTAIIQNNLENVRRLDFASLNTTANAVGRHDIAVAADDSITRVRIQSGIVKQQRVTAPLTPAAWDSWTDLVTGMGTLVACAAKGTRVIVVYVNAAGTGVRYRESTDSGVTFGVDTALSTAAAAVVDLAVAYKNTSGDLMIMWSMATALAGNKRTAGAFGGVVTNGTTFATTLGVALTYAFDYEYILTGTEVTTTKPTVWSGVYGDGVAAPVGTWSTPQAQVQAESGTTSYHSPFLTFLDAYRCNFMELPIGDNGITTMYRTWLHVNNLFTAGPFAWRTPLPSDDHVTQGRAVAYGTTHYYESGNDVVRRAVSTTVQNDVTADLLRCELVESLDDCHGWLDLQNDGGEFAGVPLTPIQLGNLVALSFGYYTTAGDIASRVQDLWITAIEHRRVAGRSTLRLFLEGGMRRLRRSYQRGQIVHAATDDYRTILARILQRAGMAISVGSASTRSDTITPQFTILPEDSGHEAMRRCLAFLADALVVQALGAVKLVETLTSESTDYTVGGAHPLYEATFRQEPSPVSEMQAITHNAGVYVLGVGAVSYADAEYGLAPLQRIRDLHSTTAATAGATAVAHARQRKMAQRAGRAVVPPICGLELLDVIDFTDALISASAVKQRVMEITWKLDRTRQLYEQHLTLGAM